MYKIGILGFYCYIFIYFYLFKVKVPFYLEPGFSLKRKNERVSLIVLYHKK